MAYEVETVSEELRNIPQHKEFIGYGTDAIFNTVSKMKDIINQSAKNYYVRRWAEKIIEGLPNGDYLRAKAIYNWISEHVQYIRDPLGLEMLQTPPLVLQRIERGEIPVLDCDCMTMLSLSLLKTLGLRVKMRVTGYKPNSRYTHVYGLVNTKEKGWLPFDLVKRKGLGWEVPSAIIKKDIEA